MTRIEVNCSLLCWQKNTTISFNLYREFLIKEDVNHICVWERAGQLCARGLGVRREDRSDRCSKNTLGPVASCREDSKAVLIDELCVYIKVWFICAVYMFLLTPLPLASGPGGPVCAELQWAHRLAGWGSAFVPGGGSAASPLPGSDLCSQVRDNAVHSTCTNISRHHPHLPLLHNPVFYSNRTLKVIVQCFFFFIQVGFIVHGTK